MSQRRYPPEVILSVIEERLDHHRPAEALGISSVEQSPELVAAATLDLLTDDTGRRVAPVDPDAVARVLVQPRLIVRQHPTA